MSHIQGMAKDQYLMLPPLVSEWIPENHPARIVEMFVNTMDVKELGFREENEIIGRPSYGPEVMLKIILYGYTNGERSSRKLERKTYDDIAYMWLTGNLHPDYRTIARFRQNNIYGLKELLKETLKLYSLGGQNFDGIIFSDGTKIYANASDDKVITAKKIKALEEVAENMLKEAEKKDKEEGEEEGDDNNNFLKKDSLEKIKEQIIKYKEKLSNSKQKAVSITDEEAKYMRHARGHGYHMSYNAQISVDKNGIIVETDVVTKVADDGELLKERVKGVENNTKQSVKKVVADKGYYETNAVREITEKGIECLVTPQDKKSKRNEFKYNKRKDTYECYSKKELRKIRIRIDRGKEYLVYAADKKDCIRCKFKEKCYTGQAKGWYGKTIMVLKDKEFTKKYKEVLEQNDELIKKRKRIVEPVIGTIKSAFRFRRFGLRGLKKVKAEWSLVATVVNLAKIWKLMVSNG